MRVYKEVKKITELPVICHTTPNMDSWAISRDFSAITVQTGHSEASRNKLWMLPMEYRSNENCYGSHGIWNIGDGNFLAHWGWRTFREAKKSIVPLKIGKSNKLFLCAKGFLEGNINSKFSGVGDNLSIQMIDNRGRKITYTPKVYSDFTAKDLIYNPSQRNFIKENIPDKIIVLSDFTDIENRLLKQSVNSGNRLTLVYLTRYSLKSSTQLRLVNPVECSLSRLMLLPNGRGAIPSLPAKYSAVVVLVTVRSSRPTSLNIRLVMSAQLSSGPSLVALYVPNGA